MFVFSENLTCFLRLSFCLITDKMNFIPFGPISEIDWCQVMSAFLFKFLLYVIFLSGFH